MKKLCLISFFALILFDIYPQTLSTPMLQFVNVCVKEREIVRANGLRYDEQYKQLYDCLKMFISLPIKECINSSGYVESNFVGHIVFSPSYIRKYMSEGIPDPNTQSFPYMRYLDKTQKACIIDGNYICYGNSLVRPTSNETFSFHCPTGQRQLVIIAEDDTPLRVEISSISDIILRNRAIEGYSQFIWDVKDNIEHIFVRVSNPTDKVLSFVIAIY